MSVVKMEDWYTRHSGDNFTAPEMRRTLLVGAVTGHPDFNDGDNVTTSAIDTNGIDGRNITTVDGTTYRLGEIHKPYLEFLEANNYKFDPENPIREVDVLTKMEQPDA